MEWESLFDENILNKSKEYFSENRVRYINFENGVLKSKVFEEDNDLQGFDVCITVDNNKIVSAKCSCQKDGLDTMCVHIGSTFLALEGDEFLHNQVLQYNSKKASSDLDLDFIIEDTINYAIIHNGGKVVREISLKNNSDNIIDNLVLKIKSDNSIINDFELGISSIKSGEVMVLNDVELVINVDELSSITERVMCKLEIGIYKDEKNLVSKSNNITVLSFDEWPGLKYSPEMLSAFSMPNNPFVINIVKRASKYIEEWTGDPSLNGYQSNDPNRVIVMANAVYASIQQENITYANPPSSFESVGQRVRLPDTIFEYHMGTCLDLTLLYVACLEAIGLNPIMVMMKGHIFAGVWLLEQSFSDMIMEDPSQLEKRMSTGINELLVVECTAMCSGRSVSFDKAVNIAINSVSNYGKFLFAIDVKRSRTLGIRPLPTRIKTEQGFKIEHKEREKSDITDKSNTEVEIFDIPDSSTKSNLTKINQWERKLLDLSLRNMLINMRMTKSVVPLLSSDLAILEDALSDGEEFQVLPKPNEMSINYEKGFPVEALCKLGVFKDFIELESKNHRLHSIYTLSELNSCLMKMYRTAKTSMEENGVSNLYISLGLLRWFDGKKNGDVRYAPIVLVPIDIIRKSANRGYSMRMRDEDAKVNITLLEFLKQNYNINIYGLNPPPRDNSGLDLNKIFAIIRNAVMELPMWDVIEVSFISNFSFSQFVMWNDIHSNEEFIKSSKIVNSLINGAVDWDLSIPENVNNNDVYLPVDVDSSQLKAINMATLGSSFVLHGPPGTGKSQTITALIVNAIKNGKKVLFVAEKMAALEVVQSRLASLGIEDFCLEIHSNKSTKKFVLDQLKRGLELSEVRQNNDYNKKIEDIQKIRGELDIYSNLLHKKMPFGKSLYELIDLYESIEDRKDCIIFNESYVENMTDSIFTNHINSLECLVASGKNIGHPYNNPLRFIRNTEYNQKIKFELESFISKYKDALNSFKNSIDNFINMLGLEKPITEKDILLLAKYAESLSNLKDIPKFIREVKDIDYSFLEAKKVLSKRIEFEKQKSSILENWNETFLSMDMSMYRERYDKANKKLFGKGKAISTIVSEMQVFAKFKLCNEFVPSYIADITVYQNEVKKIEDIENTLSYEWIDIIRKYPSIEELDKYKESLKTILKNVSKFESIIKDADDNGEMDTLISTNTKFIEGFESFKNIENDIVEFLDIDFDNVISEDNWFESRFKVCDELLNNAMSIKDIITYNKFSLECREKGMGCICDAYESGIPSEDVVSLYLKSVYRSMILFIIDKEPILNSFSGVSFNEKIAQFKKLNKECMDLTKNDVICTLINQLPKIGDSVVVNKELNILKRAIGSNGRGISIRQLFEQIPNILHKLCPCMLMSPISVAQYLNAKNDIFDIVIFDEASQLPTCKAVGVIARGKNVVVVGDPNQMPPTSFFAGNVIDEDNLDLEDLDSILDDCLALGMPSAHLSWHYRSRHESLISFSNKEFYENSMTTFPSVNDIENKVTLIKVDGYFERGTRRVNEMEAKAIVEEIKRRYKDKNLKKYSIGVVTFNTSQQILIEELLQKEYEKDIDFDKWANSGEAPMFVKNLENVQGDERDVILFSISFGPDENGNLSLNFGPINKEGGWKRLNVAFTRAKHEMLVFTTMTADMIDLRRTKSKGVECLKSFLEYAQKGRVVESYSEVDNNINTNITDSICHIIDDMGLKYQKYVGKSKCKIDIAVVNPNNEKEYILGIMLDGDFYRQIENTKDREISQINVLQGLGWEIYRIWTIDWWDNREKEIAKLKEVLESKVASALNRSNNEDIVEFEEIDNDLSNISEEDSENQEKDECVEDTELYDDNSNNNSETYSEDYKLYENITIEDNISSNFNSQNYDLDNCDGINNTKYIIDSYKSTCDNDIYLEPEVYIKPENLHLISKRLQLIIDVEAPISYDKLLKDTIRSFGISRATNNLLNFTKKAFEMTSYKIENQETGKFVWGKNQDINSYNICRCGSDDRTGDEICNQEVKNAICYVLRRYGVQDKATLTRETVKNMGYSRSGPRLAYAVEGGIKYGIKTGEIIENLEGSFKFNK